MPPEYLPLVPIGIGAVVRVLKSDTRLPLDVPAKHRAALAWALGAVAGVVDLVLGGAPWHAAAVAVGGPMLAQIGHVVLIEGARGGRELPVPGLMRKRRRLSGRFPRGSLLIFGFVLGCMPDKVELHADVPAPTINVSATVHLPPAPPSPCGSSLGGAVPPDALSDALYDALYDAGAD